MSGDEEQNRLLEDAIKKVKDQGFYMKRAIDQEDLKLALNHATEMLRELRTSLLSPKNYYELYMKVLDEMHELEEFFIALHRKGTPVIEVYEQVQACGNILPRLYLMICAGSVYIQSKQVPAKDILKDLVEMVKGVQQPMRGLFLRNYLTHMSRDKLPDVGSPYEGEGGTVQDSYQFILQNFAETNRLWVRLQFQGASKDKKKRERERHDLRILVGTNLVRLSQLEGVDVAEYQENVLPKILEQIVECKDTIAQSYLMDCVIQVFPDEFHIATLQPFLATCSQLKEKVNVRGILESMMDRLASYASTGAVMTTDINAFQMFNNCITQLVEQRTNLSLVEILRLHTALLNFALKCYPGNLQYVNHCISTASAIISSVNYTTPADSGSTPSEDPTVMQMETLLTVPLSQLAMGVLELEDYANLMEYLPWGNRKSIAVELLRAILTHTTALSDVDKVEKLFTLIQPLIRDKEGDAQADDENKDVTGSGFEEEQTLVARLVHLLQHEDTDTLFRLYITARRHFGTGGTHRIQFTLVPLIFAALKLSRTVHAREQKIAESGSESTLQYSTRKVFQFTHEIVTAMATKYPDLSLKLFLQCAQGADECGFSAIAYEFVASALTYYEDEIADSKAQVRALTLIIGSLMNCRNFDANDYDALVTKTTQYAAKLLKKPDQCRLVSMCSHMFWSAKEDGFRDSRRVMECLQRSLKIADVCMASSAQLDLFVELLDSYLYYYETNNDKIEERHLNGLVALIDEQLSKMEPGEARNVVDAHYKNTLEHIRRKQQDPETAEKFAGVVIA